MSSTKTLQLTVRTPEADILHQQDVINVRVMTEGGEVEIKPGHANLIGNILFSKMIISTAETDIEYIVRSGMLFVSQEENAAQVLVYECKEVKDIEYKTAHEYLQFVEEQLKEGKDLNKLQLKYLENERIGMVKQIEEINGSKAA